MYHVKKNVIQKNYFNENIEPIIFFNTFNKTETNYWPTELKISGFV